jgi:hypothetical protein
MTQDEARHAKKMEQIMASIDEKLERIASSLEKMEPKIYQLPKFDIPLNDPGINEPAPDQYLTTITAEEPTTKEENASDSCMRSYDDRVVNMFKPYPGYLEGKNK